MSPHSSGTLTNSDNLDLSALDNGDGSSASCTSTSPSVPDPDSEEDDAEDEEDEPDEEDEDELLEDARTPTKPNTFGSST
jgi:hypothetical protein